MSDTNRLRVRESCAYSTPSPTPLLSLLLTMLLLSPILLAMTVSISHVAAHGVVISFTANGKTYTGEPSPDQPTGGM